ncbi:DNA-binding protein [Mycolicibacterium chitae]|uniref:DNA-binding protein n=1 Tax=Mycolicibacterium chitae TaxID=1792 RepID=A0A3S4TLC3_MYCCI|nr:PucR family transcriptional regulator [Mycolicibacterium chitae]MCV7106320.1 helix-turn-helix domain-containing protein [Mycolicibacterium chitae]BBZ03766.1 DNA-binding protein [Mycolicibacterium chitae]VEG47421.1 DNA-binding protein [Mycolicibacterium chitae]
MITLDRLVNVLGGYGVVSRLGAVPRSTELRSVVLPEPPGPKVAGDVLLALGAASVADGIRLARDVGATAVLVRADGSADADDVAVLQVEPTVPWSELAAVVYGLVLEGRETESGRGPTDLFALADTLADAIGAPLTIEDRHSNLLAYSRGQVDADPVRTQTILGRRAPESLRRRFVERGVYARLMAGEDPFFIPAEDESGMRGRMVVAVRVGRELLGSVWVSTPRTLRGAARRALADGARTVALHLLRSRASADLERQVESEAVIRLLEGTPDAASLASRLGLPPGSLQVIAVRPRAETEPHTALLMAFEQATAGFGWSRPGRSAVVENIVYTVLPLDAAHDAARSWVAALADALPESATLWAGISGPATADELVAARREADECLALHEAAGGDPPRYDECWDDILLQRLRAAAGSGRGPTRGPVAELLRHDEDNGTRFVVTLRAWLEAQGDAAGAAEILGVHENTVRNRLRKLIRVARVDLSDPRKRMALMIELAAL